MARSISSEYSTPIEELRYLLDESEKRAVNIRGAGADQAYELLQWLDRIYALIPELEARGADIQPELGRWSAVQGSVQRHSSAIQKELAGLGGLAKLRAEQPAPPEASRWWWWLDVSQRQRTTQRVRKAVIVFVAVVAVLALGALLLKILFPVDPTVSATYKLQTEADRLLQENDMQGAIAKLEEAAALAPNELDTQATLVALYTVTGETDRAKALSDKLFAAFPSSTVKTQLAGAFLALNEPERARDLAESALEEDVDNTMAYLMAASAYEALGDRTSALFYLQQASDTADRTGEVELQALARIRLGQMLQSAPGLQETPTPSK